MKASNSRIQLFKQCRRAYQLRYQYDLVPIQTTEALQRGLSYHDKIEQLLKTGEFVRDDDLKTNAMATAFKKHIIDTKAIGIDIEDVEGWFEFHIGDSRHSLVGRVDARGAGDVIIEHKTVSGLIDGAYLQRLDLDEQILSYMLAFDTRTVLYTVCATPSIRQKKDESDEDFEARCVEWFEDDTAHKITVLTITKTDEEIADFAKEIELMLDDIENCVHYYRNPNSCMKWGRLCEYAPICNLKTLTEENLINFTKRQVNYDDKTGDVKAGTGDS